MRMIVVALVLLGLAAAPVQAKPLVTLTVSQTSPVVLGVEIPNAYKHAAGHLWVTMVCRVDGEAVSLQHRGVEFGGSDLTSGTAGPFSDDGDCEAFAWVYPDAGTKVSNVLEV